MSELIIIAQRFPFPPRHGDQLAVSKLIKAAQSKLIKVTVWLPYREYQKWDGKISNIEFKKLIFDPLHLICNFFKYPLDPLQVKLFSGYRVKNIDSLSMIYIHSIRLSRVISSNALQEVHLGAQINHAREFFEISRDTAMSFKSLIYYLEAYLIENWYRKYLSLFRTVFSVSINEFQEYGLQNLLVFSHGANLPLIKEIDYVRDHKKLKIGFWGNIDFTPNFQAALRFSRVAQTFSSDFDFVLFGRGSGKFLNDSDFNKVKILGEVESIIEEIDSVDILLNLVDSGAGFQNKTLEAWCRGVLVVGFSSAFRGLEGSEHLHYVIDEIDKIGNMLSEINRNEILRVAEDAVEWVKDNRDPDLLNNEKLAVMEKRR